MNIPSSKELFEIEEKNGVFEFRISNIKISAIIHKEISDITRMVLDEDTISKKDILDELSDVYILCSSAKEAIKNKKLYLDNSNDKLSSRTLTVKMAFLHWMLGNESSVLEDRFDFIMKIILEWYGEDIMKAIRQRYEDKRVSLK
jgi:hypothetical protein